ncbi:ALA-interacting subunit 3 [Tripterygium wilfordii]|uniref:ALA-interacting subunit n=1 Tax=Tripterygium wilfordii TaxID=458696 RepID=A0A7J7DV71_TRIWF|nr:ALA-interacting subunit 1-like [Tripterygium wilfordii]KAF5750189.1 ALA-interacting subunit 3 [Tripterygium wilfordii]
MKANEATSSGGGGDDNGANSDPSSGARKHSKRPKYSKFTQQELPACKPILTPGWVISTFILIGCLFIPIGLVSLFASESVVEIVDRYDETCIPGKYSHDHLAYIQSGETNKTCTRSVIVPKHMKGPVFLYYQLENFYQNHRRYVKSRDDNQLQSKNAGYGSKECEPERGTPDRPIVPCGLIAWSLFNDTYRLSVKNKVLEINKKNIAWKSDKERKFGSDVYPKNFQSGGLIGGAKLNSSIPLSEQEDLIVWMRTAALSTFRKLYGRIEEDLKANEEISITIENNYNTYSFGGKKKLVLSTTSWIGGKNDFLGIAYLTVGGLSLFLAISFILVYVFKPRPLGDTSYLSWNKHPSGHAN